MVLLNRFLFPLLFLTVVCYAKHVSSQERSGPFIVYKAGNGISNGLNYHVCQSGEGFIWVGTGNGLVKFDGFRYHKILAGSSGITDNLVVDVAEAADGKIWIAGFTSGISRFDPETQHFRRYPQIGRSGSDMQQVNKILTLPDGQVWLGTGNMGLALYEQPTDTFRFLTPESRVDQSGHLIRDYTVRDMVTDLRDTTMLWLVTGGEIYHFNRKTFVFNKCQIQDDRKRYPMLFTSLAHDGDSGLWIGTWGDGMKRYDFASHRIEELVFRDSSGKPVEGILAMDVEVVGDTSVLWACAMTGLISYNPSSGSFTNISPTFDTAPGAGKPNYQSISVTPDAGIFIGASGFLLQMHPHFTRLGRKLLPEGLFNSDLLFGSTLLTTPGLSAYYLATAGPVSLLKINARDLSSKIIKVRHPSPIRGLCDMAWYRPDEIIAAGYDGLLYHYGTGDAEMKTYQIPKFNDHSVLALETDRKGFLWILTKGCLWRMSAAHIAPTDSFTIQTTSLPEKYKEWPLKLYSLLTDSRGNAWVSSNMGVWMIDPASRKVLQFSPQTLIGKWMRHELVKSCTIDQEDRLWIGYNGDGLQVMDTRTLLPVEFSDPMDFPACQVNDLVATPRGKLLAATTEGLLEIDMANASWNLFNSLDGLSGQNVEAGLFATGDGKVFVPFFNRYHVFSETSLATNHDLMRINITNLLINGETRELPLEIAGVSSLRLSHRQNNIRIDFAAMHWQYPFRTRYSFRLFEGKDTTRWYGLSEPTLYFSGLRPGRYTLQLAALGSGKTTSWPMNIQMLITPPFWLQSWFIFLVNMLVITVLYGLFRFRVHQLRKSAEVRNSISQNLHDDIGSSLSHIRIMTELASRNLNNPEKSKSLLEKTGDDLQSLSEALSDIVWNVNPKHDALNNLFLRMKRYAADTFEGRQIQHELQFQVLDHDLHLKMDMRRDLYLIFKESIHNLVRHAGATRVTIKVEMLNKQLLFVISDNGKGFDSNRVYPGNGLSGMVQRALRNHWDLDIASEPGKGCTLSLRVPLR